MTLNRSIAPKITPATSFNFNLPAIAQEVLPNGAFLYFLNSGVQEVVNLELYFPAGLIHENQRALSKTAAEQLRSGTTNKTAKEISAAFEQLGTSVRSYATNDYGIVSISCLSKHLESLLPLLYEIITDAQYAEDELTLYKQQALQGLDINLKKCDFVANRLIDEYIYGYEHPYGAYINKTDYELITKEILIDFRQRNYKLSAATLFLSGRYDAKLKETIVALFGQESGTRKDIVENNLDLRPSPEKKHRITNDPQGVQGAIRLGYSFIDRNHPDFIAMNFVNTLFGGYFGSRLMSNIREDKGYTYGIYSYIQSNKLASTYMVATEAGIDVCEEAVQEVYNEMHRLQSEKVHENELQLVKNYVLGNLLGSLDGPIQIMNRWKGLILNNYTEERFYQSVSTYKTIDSDKVMELANKYLQAELFYDLIVI